MYPLQSQHKLFENAYKDLNINLAGFASSLENDLGRPSKDDESHCNAHHSTQKFCLQKKEALDSLEGLVANWMEKFNPFFLHKTQKNGSRIPSPALERCEEISALLENILQSTVTRLYLKQTEKIDAEENLNAFFAERECHEFLSGSPFGRLESYPKSFLFCRYLYPLTLPSIDRKELNFPKFVEAVSQVKLTKTASNLGCEAFYDSSLGSLFSKVIEQFWIDGTINKTTWETFQILRLNLGAIERAEKKPLHLSYELKETDANLEIGYGKPLLKSFKIDAFEDSIHDLHSKIALIPRPQVCGADTIKWKKDHNKFRLLSKKDLETLSNGSVNRVAQMCRSLFKEIADGFDALACLTHSEGEYQLDFNWPPLKWELEDSSPLEVLSFLYDSIGVNYISSRESENFPSGCMTRIKNLDEVIHSLNPEKSSLIRFLKKPNISFSILKNYLDSIRTALENTPLDNNKEYLKLTYKQNDILKLQIN